MDESDWTQNSHEFEAEAVDFKNGARSHDEARRRLLRLGAGALTDGELVGLLAGVTNPAHLAQLMEFGLHSLAQRPMEALLEAGVLAPRAACRLAAASELARRLGTERRCQSPRLSTPQAIWQWARPRLMGAQKEEFHVLCLNARHALLRDVRVAEGSVDQCHVDPRDAFAPAVACRASAVVLVHNHPSGDPEPSVNDVALTRQLRDGARLLCIRLLDHVVVADRGFVSMATRGLLGRDGPVLARLQSPVDGARGE